jgi:hypothetical protein
MAQVAARRVDSTKSIPDEPVARTARSTRGRGAKRPASSLQSHPLSDCDSDFDAEEELIEQDSGTDGCSSDEEPSTKRSKASKGKGSTGAKASSKRVRVVRSTAGPAAVAKGTGLNRWGVFSNILGLSCCCCKPRLSACPTNGRQHQQP